MNDGLIKQHTWKTIRETVKNLSPEFSDIIDELNPSDDYSLYLIKYPYGSLILDKGKFQIPVLNNNVAPLNEATVSEKIKQDLSYSDTVPLGLIVKNYIETYIVANKRILPAAFRGPGKFVSLWRVLDDDCTFHIGPFWNMVSGARSICILPKVSDSASNKILKLKYGLKMQEPLTLTSQWKILTHIANHSSFPQKWFSELLFFSKRWFQNRNDKKWAPFYYYVWENSMYRRNQFVVDYGFSIAQENGNLKANPYLVDTVKHLIAIGSGAVPAFAPAVDDAGAPVSGFQEVYLKDYGLKKYAPIIMHLHHFSEKQDEKPVYYSFQMPTTTTFSPRSKQMKSIMTEMQELRYIMDTFLSEILSEKLGIEKTPLHTMAKTTRYGYYHSDEDSLGEIQLAKNIYDLDRSFNSFVNHEYNFPEFAPFFKGCISISK